MELDWSFERHLPRLHTVLLKYYEHAEIQMMGLVTNNHQCSNHPLICNPFTDIEDIHRYWSHLGIY